MSAPDLRALAVAVLWSHMAAEERRGLELSDVEELVGHVERCLTDASQVLVERAALWTGELGDDVEVPRQAELYRSVWLAAAKGRVTP